MQVRAATPDDYGAFCRFWAQLGLQQPVLARDYWVAHLRADTLFVVADDGQLAAYALTFAFGARRDVRQIALYRAVGMQHVRDIYVLTCTREVCERFAATRSQRLAVDDVTARDDAALEHALDLGGGQLARWRTQRPHAPMRRVGTHALAHIRADFAPGRGLLFPFRAPDADTAAHLMAAALPGPDEYEVFAVDPPVHAALVAAGAQAYEHLVELGGPLP